MREPWRALRRGSARAVSRSVTTARTLSLPSQRAWTSVRAAAGRNAVLFRG